MKKIKMKSLLSNQDIFDYKTTPNVLIYKGINIPCQCVFRSNHIEMDVTVFVSETIMNIVTEKTIILINGVEYYIADNFIKETHVGDVVKVCLKLVSKEEFEIEKINMLDNFSFLC